jgi:hypothetical protein
VKKLAIGCLVILVLAGIAGAVGTWWVYRKVTTTVGQFAELGSVPELERSVRNTRPFAPPATGELTAAQVERLVQVQRAVRARLGQRFAEMQQKYKTLLAKEKATVVDLPQLVAAYRDLAAAWMDAKRAQVEALNEAGFSLDEYRWVRRQAYAAVGLPIVDLDVSRLIENIQKGTAEQEPAELAGSVGPSGPEVNRQLVEPYRQELEDNAALASFGL